MEPVALSDSRQRYLLSRANLGGVEEQRTRSNQRLAWLLACAVVLGWGVNFVLAKHALNQFSVGSFNFIRFGGMVALGWTVIAITG